MTAQPLALCVKHVEPVIHRAGVACPLCALEAKLVDLQKQLRDLMLRKS